MAYPQYSPFANIPGKEYKFIFPRIKIMANPE
jgi:hypothetical protein